MKRISLLIVFTFAIQFSNAQETNFDSMWSNGYKLTSTDKQFKMKFGGRIMYDIAVFTQDDTLISLHGKQTSGTEFRRVRFFNSGQIYNNVKYKVQFDFTGGDATFKDVYIEFAKIPVVGSLRLGHFKEPLRLETLTSSKYMTFMERAFPVDFMPERNNGFMFYNEFLDKKLSAQIGCFFRSGKYGDDNDIGLEQNITARVTALPIYDKENNRLLHLGLGYSLRRPDSKEYSIASIPESHLSHKYVGADVDSVKSVGVFSTEAALVMGALSVQGEYTAAAVSAVSSYSFSSYYGQVSYFITGESRAYKNSLVGFGRVKPKKNIGEDGGKGAWEVAFRYSSVNLNSNDVLGGSMNDVTLGVNWHLNPATRVMANYVLASVGDVGSVGIFQMRAQIDF